MFTGEITILRADNKSFKGNQGALVAYFVISFITAGGNVIKVTTTKELFDDLQKYVEKRATGVATLELQMKGEILKAKLTAFDVKE